MKDAYADGISLEEVGRRLDELDFGLTCAHVAGAHDRVLDFTLTALQKKHPVILDFARLSASRQHHAVIATATEGRLVVGRYVPSAILVTDSSEEHPGILPHNARLEFSPSGKRERSALYVTTWDRYRVTLASAMSLRLTRLKRSDCKPP